MTLMIMVMVVDGHKEFQFAAALGLICDNLPSVYDHCTSFYLVYEIIVAIQINAYLYSNVHHGDFLS